MIPVSKPFLPPLDKYQKLLHEIWDREWLTNNGPLVNDLELELKNHLQLDHMLFVGNGTLALQLAIKALGLKKNIITTPFTYIATLSSIVWEGCTPQFADIDEGSLNISPATIERVINEDTQAILATHCFGNPCDIAGIDKLAKKYNLKVIYDASHCFGTTYKGKSIFVYGDISTCSFHATKLYHTVEGGAVFTQNGDMLKKMAFMRNFGHNGPVDYKEVGINGKNSEFHAAMGLVNLKFIDEIMRKRLKQSLKYDELLKGLNVAQPKLNKEGESNRSYYPIVFQSEPELEKVISELNKHEIFPRRYFYPSLNLVDQYANGQSLPIAESVSKRVLCLPLYHGLSESEQRLIARLLLRVQNN